MRAAFLLPLPLFLAARVGAQAPARPDARPLAAARSDSARRDSTGARRDSAAATAPAPAAAAALPSIAVHGFVSATMFAQDASFGFGNGQSAAFIAPTGPTRDRWFLGGDVRNTRLTFATERTALGRGWSAAGAMEVDFFGGFNGAGAFSDEQPQLRLRTVYADLERGRTTIRLGQAPTPVLGLVPASVAHVAFPLGIGSAGMLGWREPGLFVTQRLATGATKSSLTVAAMRGSWTGPGNVLEQQSAGEASAIPQLEARLDLAGRAGRLAWTAYGVAHWDRKDLSGVGPDTTDAGELTGTALEAGGRLVAGRLTLQGNGYRGRAIGQLFGNLAQFGDIAGWGAWGQAGLALSARTSAWYFHGVDDPDDADVRAAIAGASRLRNVSRAAMLRLAAGPYTLGAEWLASRTRCAPDAASPATAHAGHQFALSVMHTF